MRPCETVSATPPIIRRRLYEAAYHRLRTLAGGRWAHHCRPTSIIFALTEHCNARCVHCDIWLRVRRERSLGFTIRLKNVIMSHNLDDTLEVARYATRPGMDVFFQPIEQNYNTPEDPRWFEHSDNWPRDTERVVGIVRQLIELKRDGWHIANSYEQLEAMAPYFRDPDASRVATQAHSAHEHRAIRAGLSTLDIRANGDVSIDPRGAVTPPPGFLSVLLSCSRSSCRSCRTCSRCRCGS